MNEQTLGNQSSLIPCLRYRDAHQAMDWLGRVFGFRPDLVVTDDENHVVHAQLHHAGGMIMIGTHGKHGGEYDHLVAHPDEVGGRVTQSVYVVVADPDHIYSQAKAAGASIEIEIRDEEYGGRGFTCRDLEGHLWTIGSYDPWDSVNGGDEP